MIKKHGISPLYAYMIAIGAWFFAFGLQTIVFPAIVIFELQEGPDILGIAQAALSAPMLFLLIPAGFIADHFNMRKTLWRLYLLACVPSIALILIFELHQLTLPFLYLYAITIGTISALSLPSRDAALNSILDIHQTTPRTKNKYNPLNLQKAVVITQTIQFACQIIGIGTAIYAKISLSLFLQILAFLIASIAAYILPDLKHHTEKKLQINTHKLLFSDSIVLGLIIMMFSVGMFAVGAGFLVIIPIIVRDVFQGGYLLLSITISVFWIGAFISVVCLMLFKNIKKPGRLLLICQSLGMIAYLGLTKVNHPAIFLLIIASWGITGGVVMSMGRYILQHRIPKNKLGRIMSLYQLGFVGGTPIGALIFGFVLNNFSIHTTILIASLCYSLTMLIIFLLTPLWSLDDGVQYKNKTIF